MSDMDQATPSNDDTTMPAEGPPPEASRADPSEVQPPLFRELAGQVLRARRQVSRLRLVDVAERAGVSPQYVSEIERGIKDPSSEMLADVAGALGMDLDDLLDEALRRRRSALHDATATQVRARPVGAGPVEAPRVGNVVPFTRPAGSASIPLTRTIDPVCRAA
jgi:transcriptional regulator with XRE-family HTH domain